MRFVVCHTKFPLDHFAHASTRPDLTAETVGFSSMGEKLGDLLLLDESQFWRTSGTRASAQSFWALRLSRHNPLANCGRGDPKCRGNVLLSPAHPFEFQRVKTTRFLPIGEI
jgi:hypothetical protein